MKKTKTYEQEILEWRWRQLCLQRKYNNTPAGFKSEEQERLARSLWEQDVQRFREGQIYRILSRYQPSEEIFVGRKDDLERIHAALEKKAGPVVLYGMGGIGKSALARAYVRQHMEDYDHILFLSFSSTMQSLLVDDFSVRISNLQYSADEYGNQKKYFQIKCRILRQIAKKERILIVIDDCNIKGDKHMQDVFSLPCDFLVTTRRNPILWGDYPGIEVSRLQTEEEWRTFIDAYRTKELSPEEMERIAQYRDMVQGHTLMMQQRIHNPEKEFKGFEDFKRGIFQRFPLKKEEKQAMTYLSIMPVQGIPRTMFQTITGIGDEAIDQLKNDMFIQTGWDENWKDSMLSLHPIIAEAARMVFKPSCLNCGKLLIGLYNYLRGKLTDGRDTWGRTYAENQRLEPYIYAVIRAFPEPAPWLCEAFDELYTFYWIQEYFEEAKSYEEKLYRAVCEYYGESHPMTAWIALRVAAVYYNSLDFQEARAWYQKGLAMMQRCPASVPLRSLYLGQAYHKAARLYRYDKDYSNGLQMARRAVASVEQAIEDARKHKEDTDRFERSLTHCLLEEGKNLFSSGELPEAEAVYREIQKKMPDSFKKDFYPNEFQCFYIDILMAKKDYSQAEPLAKECVERAVRFRGESFKDTLSCRELLADVYIKLGKVDKAMEEYHILLGWLQKKYPRQREWIERICRKIIRGEF